MTTSEEAKELLGLIATPSALVTGTLLSFVESSIKQNVARVNRVRMGFGFAASLGATGVMAALTVLMLPMLVDALLGRAAGKAAVWIVFGMLTMSVIGTLIYCFWTLGRCITQLRRSPD